ncbi:MAG: DUF1700 domain-containing protein [Lachnospira sp.]|nr:DUF1700 domain-containing protein [Lachnospira sp.]
MNRKEFMEALRKQLRYLPKEDREDAIGYYEEYLMDLDVSEEEDITSIVGQPKEVVQAILADCTEKHYEEQKEGGSAKKSGVMVWLVILGIFAAPFAFPVAIMILCLLFMVLILAASIVFTVLCFVVAIILAGAAALVGVVWAGSIAQRVVCLGMGLAFIGAGLLGVVILVELAKVLTRGIVALFKRVFSKKEERV